MALLASDADAATPDTTLAVDAGVVDDADPYGDDLHLALQVCYELHYRGFAGVDAEWEWNPALLTLRARLERVFRAAVVADTAVSPDTGAAEVEAEMDALSTEPIDGEGPSWFLRQEGTWEQMREMFALRSIYHLKEADPHAWAIPRLSGQAKASFVAVEFDEFGGGRGDRVHQQLFADLMRAADLYTTYLGYLDRAPAAALVPVNLMTMFGSAPRVAGCDRGPPRGDRDHVVAGVASSRRGAAASGRAAGVRCLLPRTRRGRRRPRAGAAHRRGR